MTVNLLRLAEGPQAPFLVNGWSAEGQLGSTEGCFRSIQGLLRLKQGHFRPIEDRLGCKMVF